LEEELEGSVSYFKMQSMNQSLAALVCNGAVTLETALASSSNPGDLDLILRKLLYAAQSDGVSEGDEMAEPLSDFSKIAELQEVKRLYDELQEGQSAVLTERDAEIAHLKAELARQAASGIDSDNERLREENDRLNRQVQLVREEYEAKIERLNARIRELSDASGTRPMVAEPERKGFFRR
jgi:hypothetical protein